jgi:hypothetical protein
MTESQVRPAGAARIWAGGLSITTTLVLIVLMVPAPDVPAHAVFGSAVW